MQHILFSQWNKALVDKIERIIKSIVKAVHARFLETINLLLKTYLSLFNILLHKNIK